MNSPKAPKESGPKSCTQNRFGCEVQSQFPPIKLIGSQCPNYLYHKVQDERDKNPLEHQHANDEYMIDTYNPHASCTPPCWVCRFAIFDSQPVAEVLADKSWEIIGFKARSLQAIHVSSTPPGASFLHVYLRVPWRSDLNVSRLCRQ